MSTKIYHAYRMPTNVFSEDLLPSFRKHVFYRASDRVRQLMSGLIKPDLKLAYELDKPYWPKVSFKAWCVEPKYQLFTVFKHLSNASKSRLRDSDCIDCSMNVWLHHSKVYCILYGEPWLWEGYNPPAKVENYSYWNNTDGPNDVPYRKWQARGKMWDKVCLEGDWNATRLVHDIVHASQKIGLHEVGLHIVDKDAIYTAMGF